jgi:hypothetical protein
LSSLLQRSAHEHVIMIIAKATALMWTSTNAAHSLWELALPTHRREMVSATFSNLPAALRTGNQKAHIVVVFAQPLYCGRTSTNSALLKWVSAFLAKVPAVVCGIGLRANLSTAFITCIRKQNLLSGRAVVVMENAEPSTKVWLSTHFAECPWSMDKVVLGLVPAQLEVLNPVVMPDLIDVVYFLLAIKEPSKVLLHNQPMLPNISPVVAVGMVWEFDSDIAILILILISGLSVGCSAHKRKDFTCPS